MSLENYFELGNISKAYSFKGEVILFIDADDPSHYYKLKNILIEINGRLIPYFIEKSAIHKINQLKLKLEGIDSQVEANQIIKKTVYLPIEQLPELKEDQFYYHQIIGYQVIDNSNQTIIGEINNIIDHPGNTLIEVYQQEKEIIIPLNDHTFNKIEKEKKLLYLDIPEGLLGIYLDDE